MTFTKRNCVLDLSDPTNLQLPEDVSKEFCGPVYVIVELDSAHEINENDELNNMMAAPITIDCGEGETDAGETIRLFYFGFVLGFTLRIAIRRLYSIVPTHNILCDA